MEPRGWLLLFGNFNFFFFFHFVVHFGLPTITQLLLLTQKGGEGGGSMDKIPHYLSNIVNQNSNT